MSKDKISDYSATANSNTDIGGINIDEGCAPSGINDAIRTLMKQLKDWQSGSQDVYIHPAGSASAPSITATGDTNTGIFFPAADTVGITTGGTERLRLDSSGNLGLGVTPSAWSLIKAFQLPSGVYLGSYTGSATPNLYLGANNYFNGTNFIYSGSYAATKYEQTQGAHQWYNAASGTAGNAITWTQAMTLDASGRLGIGVTSMSYPLEISAAHSRIVMTSATGTNNCLLRFNNTGGNAYVGIDSSGGGLSSAYALNIFHEGAYPITFTTNNTERARIDSSGNLLVGTTSGSKHILKKDNSNNEALQFENSTNSNPYGAIYYFSAAAPNDATRYFWSCLDTNAYRAYLRSNGGLANYQANNVNLSDRREKTNFAPAGDYLAKICAIPVQTFNYIDQNMEDDDGLTLGVVAQDVQAIAPELVTETDWGTEEEPKMRLSIYQTDLQYALMKSIQELKAIVDAQAAEIAALKG